MEETEFLKQASNETGKNSGKAVIVSGGKIDREYALSVFEKESFTYIIGADAGLRFLNQEHIVPTHIVGDFDSLEQDVLEEYTNDPHVTIRIFSPIKDKTDTEIALRLAVELGAAEIWLLGGNGPRVDHTLANIQSLVIPLEAGIPCIMADECNQIRLLNKGIVLRKEQAFGTYLSFMPLGGPVKGLTVTGVKYPLNDHDLTPDDSLGVSNEVTEPFSFISFKSGRLIMIMSKDGAK